MAPLNRTRGRSPSVLLNGATSASRKPQALRHRTNGLYDASLYGHFATRPALPSLRAPKRESSPGPPCTPKALASSRHLLALWFWMDQSSLVVDPVLLSSVDVTRPVLRRFEMSEFVRSDTFEDENRDTTTGKPRRLSLSVQKRRRNMILIL